MIFFFFFFFDSLFLQITVLPKLMSFLDRERKKCFSYPITRPENSGSVNSKHIFWVSQAYILMDFSVDATGSWTLVGNPEDRFSHDMAQVREAVQYSPRGHQVLLVDDQTRQLRLPEIYLEQP